MVSCIDLIRAPRVVNIYVAEALLSDVIPLYP